MSLVSKAMVLESLLAEKKLQMEIKKKMAMASRHGDDQAVEHYRRQIATSILRHEKFAATLKAIDEEAKRRKKR